MTKVFLVCSGLGYINRGYETFTRECFDVLRHERNLDITLFKGNGKALPKEIPLKNLHRNSKLAILLGKLIRKNPYWIEEITFFLSLLPHIHREKPDVIYLSDINLANFIRLWRTWTKQNYKVLFSNGGPVKPNYHFRWDWVHQVAPYHFKQAVKIGVSEHKQTLLPYGINISSELQTFTPSERKVWREKLQLPPDSPLILAVGAISKKRKRMDYVIREIANLSTPRPFLLLLGQKEDDSTEIIALGNDLLGSENFQVRTVTKNEIKNYYKIADLFTLASLNEGFGIVYAEALSYGLPCLAHDYETSRFVLGEMGYFADFNLPGSLSNLVDRVLQEHQAPNQKFLRHQDVYNRFSWDKLKSKYAELIESAS